MSGVKKYFKREFQTEKFFFRHDNAPDFYLGCWQRNRSTLPLLFLRTIIFVGCISILITSMILTTQTLHFGLWFIFLTHWGLVFNTVASVLALAVSARAFFQGPIDGSLELPWIVKAYWALYNTAIPIAFFITLFYWVMLTELSEEYAMNPVLDVFIHGVNSILMVALVLIARHPTHLMHFYWPLGVGFIYLIFTVIFHFAGGISPFGTSWIYPMIDWDKPGTTLAVAAGSAVGLIIMHSILVAISVSRDKLTERCRGTNSISISNEERYS